MNSTRSFLLEGAETRNMKAAKDFVKEVFPNYGDNEAMALIGIVKHDMNNTKGAKCKFLKGILRMVVNRELTNANIINDVNHCLQYATQPPYVDQYDQDLNGLSAQEFVDTFKNIADEALTNDKDNLSKQTFDGNTHYTIVEIQNFNEAKQYSKYTDWCVVETADSFDNYTRQGEGFLYFCLRDGFENVEKVAGENAPLDDYGLSMIAVTVNPNGSCNTITTRWNHENGGNDNVMSTEELSRIIGKNFYDAFSPDYMTFTINGEECYVAEKENGREGIYNDNDEDILGVDFDEIDNDETLSKELGCPIFIVKNGNRYQGMFHDGNTFRFLTREQYKTEEEVKNAFKTLPLPKNEGRRNMLSRAITESIMRKLR